MSDQDSEPTGQTTGHVTGDRPSYEEAREELVDVVRRLESGGTNLEESLALWERGERLAQICQDWLDGARKRLDATIAGSTDAGEGSAAGR
jgi:exodeoxyribonuclease VII small subunit